MGAVAAVGGLARRHSKEARDQLKVEVVKQRAVIEQVVALAPKGVAREFPAADCEVANAKLLDAMDERTKCSADDSEDMAVDFVEQSQVLAAFVAKDDRIHQAAGAGDNRCTAAGAAKNGHVCVFGSGKIDFVCGTRRAAEDHGVLGHFPEAQDVAGEFARLGGFEQGFVESQVLDGGVER